MTLEKTYSLEEVADALGMSTRWVRDRIKKDGVAHLRMGHVIKFTSAQYEALRAGHASAPVQQSITTGRKRRT